MIKKGAIARKRTIIGIRPLTRDDLAKLEQGREKAPAVQRLRDPHHLLARLIASGMKVNKAAELAGFSHARALQLSNADPAFMELVAEKRKEQDDRHIEAIDAFTTLAYGNMTKMERMVAEQLEEAEETGEAIPLRTLGPLIADRADRLGYGKKQTNININADFAATLERSIARTNKILEQQAILPSLVVERSEAIPSPSLPPSDLNQFKRRA